MEKKEIIDDIFKHYHTRLNYLKSIDKLISNLNVEQVLRDSEEVYFTSKKSTEEYMYFEAILERKERLEKQNELRDLLFEQLTNEERHIVDMKYNRGMNVKEMIRLLFISEATYFRKLNGIYCKLIDYYNIFEDLFVTE